MTNLTEKQKDLLRTMVQRGEEVEFFAYFKNTVGFVLAYPSGTGSELSDVPVDAGETDFDRLAAEDLIDLGHDSHGILRGKPTSWGIEAVKTNFASRPISSQESSVQQVNQMSPPAEPTGRKIFIGHGASKVWKDLKDFLSERLHLDWDEFNRESAAGRATTERLKQMLKNARFAFLVMTAEKELADGSTHARLNVIHEAGLFQGRLGFEKAIILREQGCAEFSNIHGLTHISFPRGNIKPAFEEIRQVLEREGIIPPAPPA